MPVRTRVVGFTRSCASRSIAARLGRALDDASVRACRIARGAIIGAVIGCAATSVASHGMVATMCGTGAWAHSFVAIPMIFGFAWAGTCVGRLALGRGWSVAALLGGIWSGLFVDRWLILGYWWELAAIVLATYLGVRIASHPRPVGAAERRATWVRRPISIVERRAVALLAIVLVVDCLASHGYDSRWLALEPSTVIGMVVPLAILGSAAGFVLTKA